MIYIVEDDDAIRELEQYALQSNGYTVQSFASPEPFWQAMRTAEPELVILDVMLPGEDGFSILKKLRRTPGAETLPAVMVTARTAELDVVKGLDQGADDYISKPFGVLEFVSRVKAVLRRADKAPGHLSFGGIRMDPSARRVQADGAPVELTYKEFELLHLFLLNAGQVLTRDAIMQQVWGTDFCGESRTVDMHVRTLRQKLGNAGRCIQTVRKVGYRLALPEDEGTAE